MAASIARAVVLGTALLVWRGAFAADEAREAATSFYRNYLGLRQSDRVSGIPNEAQLARLAPLLTPELRGLVGIALREQERCARQFPGDKPPWIEGDIFSSNFEGFSSFKADGSRARKQGREVAVRFSYVEGKTKVEWTDTLVLRNETGRWRVDDVFYRANFAVTSGFGTNLKSSLRNIPAC